jgi:hypothetical protein
MCSAHLKLACARFLFPNMELSMLRSNLRRMW